MYNKINIVESKTPPTNKNDWWYDLNTGVLKRFSGGKYNSVVGEGGNTPTPEVSWMPVPDLYANISSNELLIFTEEGAESTPDVSVYGDDYEIESEEYDSARGAWVITLSDEIPELSEDSCELNITNFSPSTVVVFPDSLRNIYRRGIVVTCNDEPMTLVFTSKQLEVSDKGIYYDDGAGEENPKLSIVTYSHTLIKTASPIVDDVDNLSWGTPIYVQPSLLEEYRNEPIDEMYNIQPIE